MVEIVTKSITPPSQPPKLQLLTPSQLLLQSSAPRRAGTSQESSPGLKTARASLRKTDHTNEISTQHLRQKKKKKNHSQIKRSLRCSARRGRRDSSEIYQPFWGALRESFRHFSSLSVMAAGEVAWSCSYQESSLSKDKLSSATTQPPLGSACSCYKLPHPFVIFLALFGLGCKSCKRCILTFASDYSRTEVVYEPTLCEKMSVLNFCSSNHGAIY